VAPKPTRSASAPKLAASKTTVKPAAKTAVKPSAAPVKAKTTVKPTKAPVVSKAAQAKADDQKLKAKVAAKGPGTVKPVQAKKPSKPADVKKVKAAAISKKPKADLKLAKIPSKDVVGAVLLKKLFTAT
jgi:cell envelope opacity-associated protein A